MTATPHAALVDVVSTVSCLLVVCSCCFVAVENGLHGSALFSQRPDSMRFTHTEVLYNKAFLLYYVVSFSLRPCYMMYNVFL